MKPSRAAATTRLTYVWIVLSALTVATRLVVSTDDGHHLTPSAPVTVAVLAIAFVKARLIIREFMEVRHAPRWLRLFMDGWLAVLLAVVAVAYLIGRG